MDNEKDKQPAEAAAEESGYAPRPAWQIWCARVALVFFIIIMLSQILRMARGGL